MLEKRLKITTLVYIFATLLLASAWVSIPTSVTEAEKEVAVAEDSTSSAPLLGKSILIDLDANMLFLRNDGETTDAIRLVSQGKPGSYYETIGGQYVTDYKEAVHFSSIGHVYMPYSVHIFGNYFIHGIPYYPLGEKVSSEYSGGCIRLEDADAKKVYDFVESTTPVIITRGSEYDFMPTRAASTTITSINMTRLMVAAISLEFLTQDDSILSPNGKRTTRRKLLPDLLDEDDKGISALYAHEGGEGLFVAHMNEKAKALGLTNTVFTGIHDPVMTTEEDYGRFMNYIMTYKSYLAGGYKDQG